MVSSLFGMFFLGVLFMQHVLGYSAIGTGVAFLPVSLGIGVLSLGFSARLNNRFGPKATLLPGLTLVALASLAGAGAGARDLRDRPAALDAAARRRRGTVVPVADDARDVGRDAGGRRARVRACEHDDVQVGGALGLAVLATLSSTHTAGLEAAGVGRDSALTSGYHLAWAISTGIAVASIVLAAGWIRSVSLGAETAGIEAEAEGEAGVELEAAAYFSTDTAYSEAA